MPGPIRVLFNFHSTKYEVWNFPRPLYEVFLEKFPTVMFHYCTSSEDYREHLPVAEVVFTSWMRPEDLPLATNLKWLHTSAAGVTRQLYPEWIKSGVTLTNSAGARGPIMAEFVIGALIAFNRQLPRIWEAQKEHRWIAGEMWNDFRNVRTLDGRRMVIAGLGGIGQEVARLAKAFGMEVVGTKRDLTEDIPWVDQLAEVNEFDSLLPGAAVVLNCLPHTPETDKWFSAERIAQFDPDSIFINVGRGKTVDQEALIVALQSQKIRGAILDVFAEEPLPEDSELWDLPNCMVIPHVSNMVDQFWEPTAEVFFENLRRYLMKLPLNNEVDPSGAGY